MRVQYSGVVVVGRCWILSVGKLPKRRDPSSFLRRNIYI